MPRADGLPEPGFKGPPGSTCEAFDRAYGTGCFHDPGFRPEPFAAKVRPRPGGAHWPAMSAAQERAWSRIGGVGIAP